MSDAESSTASPTEPEAAPRSARRTRRLAVIGVVVAALVIGAAVVGVRSTGARSGAVTFPPGYPTMAMKNSLTMACVWGSVPGTLSLSMDNPAVNFTVWWVDFESRVQSLKTVTANMKNYSVPFGGTAFYVGPEFTKPSTFYVTWTDQSVSYYDTVTCT